MAEWLALPTLDCDVPGSNPAGGGIQRMNVRHFIAQGASLAVKKKKKKICVSADMLKKNWSVGRRNLFFYYYFSIFFFSREEQDRACNFMKIQIFC